MKKYLILGLVLSIVVSLATACGSDNAKDEPAGTNAPQTAQSAQADDSNSNDNSNGANSSDKLINDDGVEFAVDTTATGVIKDGAAPISSNTVVIGDKTYEFPMRVSELMNNGWSVPEGLEFENEFVPNNETSIIGLYLVNSDGSKINVNHVYNDSSEVKELKDCLVTTFYITGHECNDAFDFVVPGGITKKSTAADVLSVFGNPYTNSEFSYGLNQDASLTYSQHKNTNITFRFSFNEDGTLYSSAMEYEN